MSAKLQKADFPGQHEGENVQLVFRQHPVVMRRSLLLGMVIILVGCLPLLFWPLSQVAILIALVVGLGALGFWFYRWFSWYYSLYIVTDMRIIEIKQKGFFNRRVVEARLEKVHNVNYHIKGFQAVVFGYGDIIVQSYVGDLVLPYIHKPVHIHEQILGVLRKTPFSTPPGI